MCANGPKGPGGTNFADFRAGRNPMEALREFHDRFPRTLPPTDDATLQLAGNLADEVGLAWDRGVPALPRQRAWLEAEVAWVWLSRFAHGFDDNTEDESVRTGAGNASPLATMLSAVMPAWDVWGPYLSRFPEGDEAQDYRRTREEIARAMFPTLHLEDRVLLMSPLIHLPHIDGPLVCIACRARREFLKGMIDVAAQTGHEDEHSVERIRVRGEHGDRWVSLRYVEDKEDLRVFVAAENEQDLARVSYRAEFVFADGFSLHGVFSHPRDRWAGLNLGNRKNHRIEDLRYILIEVVQPGAGDHG